MSEPSPLERFIRSLKTFRVLIPVLLALLVGGGIGVVIDEDGQVKVIRIAPDKKPAVPVSVGVVGEQEAKSAQPQPDTVITLDHEAREIVQNAQLTPEQFDMAGDLRGKDDTPVAVYDGPLATPNFPGCDTRILPTNWSERAGAKVKGASVHYTAGANRVGRSDMNGLTGYASSPSAGVSWHFLIDAEGHCYYSVPLDKKSWTIGNLNRELVNIEVIGTGKESVFPAAPAGRRKLSQVIRRLDSIYHFGLRVGATNGNCTMTRPGIITHWMGGTCSGGHIDIKPYNLDLLVAGIRNDVCSARCRRAKEHTVVHARLKELRCSNPKARARHPQSCEKMYDRNRALHKAGI
jgi:hypothetical protein